MRKLEDISSEGRQARERLEAENKADHEHFKAVLSMLQSSLSCPREDVISDEVDDSTKRTVDTSGARQAIPADSRVKGQDILNVPNPMQALRTDQASAAAANNILFQNRPVETDQQNKKGKSGYTLTINDTVYVQAQWPQMNVFRSSSDIATYSSLSINEFVSGFLVYIRDCLNILKLMYLKLLTI